MSYIHKLDCCGIDELAEIREDESPEESLSNIEANDQGIIIFSDTHHHKYKYGAALAKLIRGKKLGRLCTIPATTNPRTNSKIRTWVWTVNQKKLVTFQKHLQDRQLEIDEQEDQW